MANKKAITVLTKVCEIEAFPSEYAVMAHLRKVLDNDDEDDDCEDGEDNGEDNGDDDGYDYYMGRYMGQESSSAVRRKVVRGKLSRTSAP